MRTTDDRLFQTIREKVETLTGERANGSRRALRKSDLDTLAKIKVPELKGRYASGAAPTKAEHDALVDDLKSLRSALEQAINAITSVG